MTVSSDGELPYPVLCDVLAYWRRQRGARRMPRPYDIDPLGLGARLLPHIVLVDVEADGALRYRLVGTVAREAVGRDTRGELVSTYHPDAAYTAWLLSLYRRALEGRRPIYSESIFSMPGSRLTRVNHRLMCPLSEDDQSVSRLLCAQVFSADHWGLPGIIDAAGFQVGPVREL